MGCGGRLVWLGTRACDPVLCTSQASLNTCELTDKIACDLLVITQFLASSSMFVIQFMARFEALQ